jgi:hypothetical protein
LPVPMSMKVTLVIALLPSSGIFLNISLLKFHRSFGLCRRT